MPYYKVHDILELVQKFHRSMREALGTIQVRSRSANVEWLSEQFRLYELNWQAALSAYEKQGSTAVLDTWLQFVPNDPIYQELEAITVHPEMTLEDLIEINMRFHNLLSELYETLANASASPRVQELFQQLLKQEQAIAAYQSEQSRESYLVEPESPDRKQCD